MILVKKLNIFIIIYLNVILIYIENPSQTDVNIIGQVLDILKNDKFFINLEKSKFYKNKICLLIYVFLAQKMKIEDKKIKIAKNQPKPKLI